LDAAVKQFPPQFRTVEREIVSLDGFQAGRMVIEFTISGVSGKEMLYSIKDDNIMWNVTFATAADEFDSRLPEFEQSVQTFKVKP
jgi:hypothetical protein